MSILETTGKPDVIEASDGGITLSLPIKIKRRSGRKLITLPQQETAKHRLWDTDPTPLQSALARGHRWLQMLESGKAGSLKEIAQKEGVDNSYVSRISLPPFWRTGCRRTSHCLSWRRIRRGGGRSRGKDIVRNYKIDGVNLLEETRKLSTHITNI